MIRMERYVHSRRPYAVKPGSLKITREEGQRSTGSSYLYWRVEVRAVWHRGRVAQPEACVGTLSWSTVDDPYARYDPADDLERVMLVEELLAAHDDGRYGGTCEAKLTKRGLWFLDVGSPAALGAQQRLLHAVAGVFPQVPDGYSGWWTFQGQP